MKFQLRNLKLNKKLIYIFVISISIQLTIFILIQISNWVSQREVDELWFVFLTQTIEPYTDYKMWYQPFTQQFLFKNWLPYIEIFEYPNKELNFLEWYQFWVIEKHIFIRNFIYPPLFFYVLIIPSFISVELVFIPLLLANNLLPIVIYKFLRNIFTQKVAEWGFIATALCPLYLFYSGGLVLNTSLVTLFFILTLYYLSNNRYGYAILFLGITILFKQMMIFFIPPILVYIALKSISKEEASFFKHSKSFLKYSAILGMTLFIGSLPWILITPINYIKSLLALGTLDLTFYPPLNLPGYNHPIYWFDFLHGLGAPYIVLYVFGFLNFTFIGIILLEIVITILVYHWHRKNKLNWLKFLDILVYTAYLGFLFFPRGVYKYYFPFVLPLNVLWICYHFSHRLNNDNSKRRNWILIIVFVSLIFMLIPRLYYLLLIWAILIFIIIKNRYLEENEIFLNSVEKVEITK